jgi:uncharacterized protein (TIGR01244 family)
MENVKKINDELTVAGQVTEQQLQQAVNEGYKSVLNLRSPEEQGFESDEQQKAQVLGLHYVNIPVKLTEIDDELTKEVIKQIDELPKPALIHCASGMRAGLMAFIYVATRQGMTPEQIFEQAAAAGFDCSANPQMKQFLEHYVSTYSRAN